MEGWRDGGAPHHHLRRSFIVNTEKKRNRQTEKKEKNCHNGFDNKWFNWRSVAAPLNAAASQLSAVLWR